MNKEQLIDLYINQDLSQRDIGKKLNKSQTSIRYYLVKYKIKKNESNIEKVDRIGEKICPNCNILKSKSEYYFQSGKHPRQGYWCKKCINQNAIDRLRKYKQEALDYKGGKCEICGYNKFNGALEFHHKNKNEKDFEMSKFSKRPLSIEGKIELDKCVLLCANCHREEHGRLNKTYI